MAEETMADIVGIPAPVLSFPAILRNPGLKDRYAHLYGVPSVSREQDISGHIRVKKVRRDQNEGKRWVRRKDNAHFVGNPHVVAATKKDYILSTPSNRPTFPEPLPSYLPRTTKVPVATLPTRDPDSANAGRFSLSMKGMRKELRRAGGKAEVLVRIVEAEIVEWLQGGVMLRPDESNAAGLGNSETTSGKGRAIESTGIVEVSRSPLQLIWSISDDAFARYVVHCCARYHEVISFSKGNPNERLTYLLRPNVRKPDYGAVTALETPPVTDADYSSQLETTSVDSDFVSDRDIIDSDAEEANFDVHMANDLSSIEETSLPSSPQLAPSQESLREDDEWSVLHDDTGAYGDDSSSEVGQDLLDPIASLSLEDNGSHTILHPLAPTTPGPNKISIKEVVSPVRTLTEGRESPLGRLSLHQHLPHLNRRLRRSTSSPSRSPVRTRRLPSARKKRRALNTRAAQKGDHTSFYNYLFK